MATGAHMWHDYRHADVVLAVRNLTAKDALAKPASKLVNAWLAGVPAILGPEPAYREIRRSDLDYIEVKTAQEALDALARLRSTPGLYQAMVENGRKRGADFTEPATVRRWVDLLDGPVHEAYCAWQRRPASVVRLGQLMGIAMETHAKRRHRRSILTGRRILDP